MNLPLKRDAEILKKKKNGTNLVRVMLWKVPQAQGCPTSTGSWKHEYFKDEGISHVLIPIYQF